MGFPLVPLDLEPVPFYATSPASEFVHASWHYLASMAQLHGMARDSYGEMSRPLVGLASYCLYICRNQSTRRCWLLLDLATLFPHQCIVKDALVAMVSVEGLKQRSSHIAIPSVPTPPRRNG